MAETLHKKINWLVAASVIVVITLAAAWVLTARARAPLQFGGRISYYQPACVPDITGLCPACPLCSSQYGSACASLTEIQFTPVRGSDTTFICPPKGFRYRGGTPRVGGQILGNGSSWASLFQVGVSR